jgi:hypothetical protein
MKMNQSGAVWWSARVDAPDAPGADDLRSVTS